MAHLIGKTKKEKQNKKKEKKWCLALHQNPFFLFSDKNELEIKKLKNIIRPRSISTKVINIVY